MKTLILLFSLISLSSFAQIVDEAYFSDTSSGYLDRVFSHIELEDGILISGVYIDSSTVEPVVLRLNLNGEVVWSTLDNFSLGTSQCSGFVIELFEDGFIYGRSVEHTSSINNKTLWKIDLNTGEVIWTNLFFGNYFNNRTIISDYDSTSYLICSYGTTGQPALSIIDKMTGDTLQNKYIGTSLGNPKNFAVVDQSKNIYYATSSKLYKFNGKDLNQSIWSHEYTTGNNPLEDIHSIYIDRVESIFLFGKNNYSGSSGEPIVAKIDPMTGDLIWKVQTINEWLVATSFVDDFGHLYITYQHTVFGGSDFHYSTVKINKSSGTEVWQSLKDMTPLPTFSTPQPGSSEAALSMDLDCNGNPYLTGYYGAGNYGPGTWGIMKLSGVAGSKVYDKTIILDSTDYDDLSTGIGVSLFEDSPVFVGNLENNQGEADAWYVTIDPALGTPIIRKKIGGTYQQPSETKEILNVNDSMYVLKQHGRDAVIELYDANGNLAWTETFSDSARMTAGRISVNDDHLYLALVKQAPNTNYPFYSEQVQSLSLYQLNRFNGSIVNSNSLPTNLDTLHLLDLESDDNSAFLFYKRNSGMHVIKWSPSGFSSEQLIEPATINADYVGRLNITVDLNPNNLIYAGKNSLYQIDKSSLTTSPVFNYVNSKNNYDLQLKGSALYIAGDNNAGVQQLTSIDALSFTENWSQTYSQGTFHGIRFRQGDSLYVFGVKNDSANVLKLDATGSVIWSYSRPNVQSLTGQYNDLEVYPNWDLMLLAGRESTSGQASHVVFSILNEDGHDLWSYFGEDEIGKHSFASTLATQNDSIIWGGGALNRITFNKEGFVYQIRPSQNLTTPDCFGTVGGTAYIDSCASCVGGVTGQLPCVQDCNMDWGGSAFIDSCGTCADGNTGITPILNPIDCFNSLDELSNLNLEIVPNPASSSFSVNGINSENYVVSLIDISGKIVLTQVNKSIVDVFGFAQGTYLVQVETGGSIQRLRVLLVN